MLVETTQEVPQAEPTEEQPSVDDEGSEVSPLRSFSPLVATEPCGIAVAYCAASHTKNTSQMYWPPTCRLIDATAICNMQIELPWRSFAHCRSNSQERETFPKSYSS
jgi:hypothetical protein